MSPALAVQKKKYGAITAFDLLHDKRLIASLIKEKANLVDYSHQRTFRSLDAAVEFYGDYSTLETIRFVQTDPTEKASCSLTSLRSLPIFRGLERELRVIRPWVI